MNPILENLPNQLSYEPTIINASAIKSVGRFVVGGMGGSHLSALLIKDEARLANLSIHTGYGLPPMSSSDAQGSLFIAVSHSGNTEETIDFSEHALKNGYQLAIITTGGKLKQAAEERGLPLIVIPFDGVMPPRMATGYIAVALMALMTAASSDVAFKSVMNERIAKCKSIAHRISSLAFGLQKEADDAAATVKGGIPLIYSSLDNYSLAYYLKIAMNETAKMPAFCNSYSELNHNEMAGFTVPGSAENYRIISIEDADDHPRIARRMNLTEKLLKKKGATTIRLRMADGDRTEKFWLLAALVVHLSFSMAGKNNVDPVDTSFIESFKKDLEN